MGSPVFARKGRQVEKGAHGNVDLTLLSFPLIQITFFERDHTCIYADLFGRVSICVCVLGCVCGCVLNTVIHTQIHINTNINTHTHGRLGMTSLPQENWVFG